MIVRKSLDPKIVACIAWKRVTLLLTVSTLVSIAYHYYGNKELAVDSLPANILGVALNETTPGSLHSDDAIQKAKDRYWVEYASGPLDAMRDVYVAKDKEAMNKALAKVFTFLEPIERALEEKPNYFRGNKFTLMDGAYAPLFKLMFQFESNSNAPQWTGLPKTKQWATHLVSLEVTQKSACPEYPKEFNHFFEVFDSYFPKQ